MIVVGSALRLGGCGTGRNRRRRLRRPAPVPLMWVRSASTHRVDEVERPSGRQSAARRSKNTSTSRIPSTGSPTASRLFTVVRSTQVGRLRMLDRAHSQQGAGEDEEDVTPFSVAHRPAPSDGVGLLVGWLGATRPNRRPVGRRPATVGPVGLRRSGVGAVGARWFGADRVGSHGVLGPPVRTPRHSRTVGGFCFAAARAVRREVPNLVQMRAVWTRRCVGRRRERRRAGERWRLGRSTRGRHCTVVDAAGRGRRAECGVGRLGWL